MNKEIISCEGFCSGKFHIPSFSLYENELLGIMIGNDNDSIQLENIIINFFSKIENYKSPNMKLQYANHFMGEKWFGLERLFVKNVGTYLNINANLNSYISKLIYEIDFIKPSTKINRLPGNSKRLLSLSAKASKTKYILFDTIAQDKQGIRDTLNFINEHLIKNGGAAVWLDYHGQHKEMCTKYISILKNDK